MSSRLFNRYEVLDRLGEGAQSTVYLVRDTLNQDVLKAAKVLKPDYLADHSHEVLVEEFQLLQTLDHENLVNEHECRFLPQDKAPVLITEFIHGAEPLEVLLPKAENIALGEKLRIAYQILNALRYLHRKKVIHGDLKPSNILLSRESENPTASFHVKLIDFGVSHDLIISKRKKRVGTPYYIAPEVLSDGVIPASDLYSLGVVLYRLFVSNKLPYQGWDTDRIFSTHLSEHSLFEADHFDVPQLPEAIIQLIRTCLAPDPFERPRNLSNLLRRLRFDFPDDLGEMPSPSNDTRIRHFLGMKSTLYVAQRLLQEHCPRQEKAQASRPSLQAQNIRHVLFVMAPSGGGKTRYLNEVSKLCQRERLNHHFIAYRPHYFWDHLIQNLLRQYPVAKETRRMRGRLGQVMQSSDLVPRQHLYGRYLQNLARELDGLVLLVDGLGQQLPVSFLEILKSTVSLVKKSNTLQSDIKKTPLSKLVLIFSVNNQLNIQNPNEPKSRKELAHLFSNLSASVMGHTARPKDASPSGQIAREFWQQTPEQVRALGLDGTAHLLALPPWHTKEIQVFLDEVFPEMAFSQNFQAKLLEVTRGNPGILQAVCNETLQAQVESDLSSSDEIQIALLHKVQKAKVHDLSVYNLKYYDDHGKALLALMAALETCTQQTLERIWRNLFGESAIHEVKRTFIRAFDDGIIQIEAAGANAHTTRYNLTNLNLCSTLKGLSQDRTQPLALILHKILKERDDLLDTQELLSLSRFLNEKTLWATALLELFAHHRETTQRLELAPFLEELGARLQPTDIDTDTLLRLKQMNLDLCNMKSCFEEAEAVGLNIFDDIEDRNDAFANSLRAQVQLSLGIVYASGIKVRDRLALGMLKEAVDSELLSDTDHYYALGRMALCQMRLASDREDSEDEIQGSLDYLKQARKILRTKDPLRHAILTNGLGIVTLEILKNHGRALTYLELAARIYESHGEHSRQVSAQWRIGKTLFLVGQYTAALDVLNKTLPLAERLGLDNKCAEILIYIIRTRFMMGDLRKLAPACLHLMSICERIKDMRPLAAIIEPATQTYLEEGEVDKALEMVHLQMEQIAEQKDRKSEVDLLICELLLMQIYQRMGKWEEAGHHSETVQKKILDLSGKDRMVNSAQQVHLLCYIESLQHAEGTEKAVEELDRLIETGSFEGFNQQEAYIRAFRLAATAGNAQLVQKYLPHCQKTLKKISAPERLAFFTDLGKYYLDQNDLPNAIKGLKRGSSLLNLVTNHIHRGQFFDQQARLAARQGNRELAYRRWNAADQEFQLNTKTWKPDDRENYKENSPAWQEHRVIFLLLQAGAE